MLTASASLALAGDFPIFIYDINTAGNVCNVSSLNYLSSMAECGIDYVVWTGTTDYEATSNPYGLKFIGQDTLIRIGNYNVPEWMGLSHKLVAEAEDADVNNGYQVRHNTGRLRIESAEWYCDPLEHSAGYAIDTLYGPKCYTKYKQKYLQARVRLRVWDVGVPDTICRAEYISDIGSIYDTNTIALTGTDFDFAGEWKSFTN
jgi:hypothetical protein